MDFVWGQGKEQKMFRSFPFLSELIRYSTSASFEGHKEVDKHKTLIPFTRRTMSPQLVAREFYNILMMNNKTEFD